MSSPVTGSGFDFQNLFGIRFEQSSLLCFHKSGLNRNLLIVTVTKVTELSISTFLRKGMICFVTKTFCESSFTVSTGLMATKKSILSSLLVNFLLFSNATCRIHRYRRKWNVCKVYFLKKSDDDGIFYIHNVSNNAVVKSTSEGCDKGAQPEQSINKE
jgi:hypothetical protein